MKSHLTSLAFLIFLGVACYVSVLAQQIDESSTTTLTNENHHHVSSNHVSSNQHQLHSKGNIRRRRYAQYIGEQESNSVSSCRVGEIELAISISSPGSTNNSHRQSGKISWSVQSSDGEIMSSGPLTSSSYTTTSNHQLCFDEARCHTFTFKDIYERSSVDPQQLLRSETSSSSFSVSINNIVVFENPGHVFPSLQFDFGHCDVGRTSPIETLEQEEQQQVPVPLPQILQTTPSPSPSTNPTSFESKTEQEVTMSSRCETEIMLVIVLLLFILIPRAGPLLCCIKSIWCYRMYMRSGNDNEKSDEDEDDMNNSKHSKGSSDTSTLSTDSDSDNEENDRLTNMNNDDDENSNSEQGAFQSFLQNVATGLSIIREVRS